jgi:hypothetical protein
MVHLNLMLTQKGSYFSDLPVDSYSLIAALSRRGTHNLLLVFPHLR